MFLKKIVKDGLRGIPFGSNPKSLFSGLVDAEQSHMRSKEGCAGYLHKDLDGFGRDPA